MNHKSPPYTSPIPWENRNADCIAITCSDSRFRDPTLDFLAHLGYPNPHVLALPTGIATVHSQTAHHDFLSEAVMSFIAKAIEVSGLKELVCIAHHDCLGYRPGETRLIGDVAPQFANHTTREIQIEHIRNAAVALSHAFKGIDVRMFYADVIDTADGQRVEFTEISDTNRRVAPA